MIRLKNPDQIKRIRDSGLILAELFIEIEKIVQPGISTKELDRFALDFLEKRKAKAAFLGYNGFPGAICTSRNSEVIHGIPSKDCYLKEGDILGCDIGVDFKGYISDSAKTFPVGKVKPEVKHLLQVTKDSLEIAIKQAITGNRIKDIGKAITEFIEPTGFGIVHSYCGHGVGFTVHEDPQISNFYPSRGPNPRIKQGMVLAIEPMINMGTPEVELLDDGWTVETVDGSLSAHFEHTVAVFEDHTEILTKI